MNEKDQSDTDERVAAFIQSGRPEAFGVLVDRYEAKLKRYGERFLAKPEDIEDIVQEVFMKAYVNIMSFDTERKFSPWIYRIAHNAFVNKLRQGKREKISFLDLDTLVSHPQYEEEESERDRGDMKLMLGRALESLEAKYREVLVLYYIEDFAYKEIAEILSVPISTVGIRLKRGKEALRTAYMNLEK